MRILWRRFRTRSAANVGKVLLAADYPDVFGPMKYTEAATDLREMESEQYQDFVAISGGSRGGSQGAFLWNIDKGFV